MSTVQWNKTALRRVAKRIEAAGIHRFNMKYWFTYNGVDTDIKLIMNEYKHPECNTTACVAGYTCIDAVERGLSTPRLDNGATYQRTALSILLRKGSILNGAGLLFFKFLWPRSYRDMSDYDGAVALLRDIANGKIAVIDNEWVTQSRGSNVR